MLSKIYGFISGEHAEIRAHVKQLSHDDLQTRQDALNALWSLNENSLDIIREAEGIVRLVELLRDSNRKVKIGAVRLLWKILDWRLTNTDRDVIRETGGIESLVELLAHTNTRKWALEILLITSYLRGCETDHQDAIREAGGIESLVSLLKDVDPEIKKSAVLTLKSLSLNNLANQDAIREAGGIFRLVNLLKDIDKKVREYAWDTCECLDELATNEDAIIVSLLGLLKDADKNVRKRALSSLWHYVDESPKKQYIIINNDALPLLSRLAQKNQDAQHIFNACQSLIEIRTVVPNLSDRDLQVRRDASRALMSLSKANKDAILEERGIVPLVSLLRDADAEVRKNAVMTLPCLWGLANQDAIREAGGMGLLLGLLRDTDAEVRENAALILGSLTDRNPTNRDALREAGGIELLLGLLRDTDAEVRESVGSVLWRIAKQDTTCRDIIMRNGAKQAERISFGLEFDLELGMRESIRFEHKDRVTLKSFGDDKVCRCLSYLSYRDLAKRRGASKVLMSSDGNAIRFSGGVARLVSSLRDADPEVRKNVVSVLWNMAGADGADGRETRVHIRLQDWVLPLVELLRDNDAEVVQNALKILNFLAFENPTSQNAIQNAIQSQDIMRLVSLLGGLSSDERRHAAWALGGIAVNNTTKQDAIREAGGIVPIVMLLKDEDAQVKKNAVWALANLAYRNPKNQAIIIDNNALPLLRGLARTNEYAQKTLDACQPLVDSRDQQKKTTQKSSSNTTSVSSARTDTSSSSVKNIKNQNLKPPARETPTNIPMIPSNALRIERSQVLGEGSFGVVYWGIWHMVPVAVKQLHATRLTEASLQSFQKEAQRHALLRHPNIVMLYGVCIDERYGMVLEFMSNGSLYDVLHSNQDILWPVKLSIARNIANGLYYLHENNIIHRDLKSLNVLLDDHNQAKLADFGLADVKAETHSTTTKSVRTPGITRWMAPELFERGARCTTSTQGKSTKV